MKLVIKDAIENLVDDLLYHDRIKDRELPNGAIETEIDKGDLSVAEIVAVFKKELIKSL